VYNKKFFCDFYINHLNELDLDESEKIKHMSYLKNNVIDIMPMISEKYSFNRLTAKRKQSLSLDNAFNIALYKTFNDKQANIISSNLTKLLPNVIILKAYKIAMIHQFIETNTVNFKLDNLKQIKQKILNNLTVTDKQCIIKYNNKSTGYKFKIIMPLEHDEISLYAYETKQKVTKKNTFQYIIKYFGKDETDNKSGILLYDDKNNDMTIQLDNNEKYYIKNLKLNYNLPIKITYNDSNKILLLLRHTGQYSPYMQGILNAHVKKDEEYLPIQKNVNIVWKSEEIDSIQSNSKDSNILKFYVLSQEETNQQEVLQYGELNIDLNNNKIIYYPIPEDYSNKFEADYVYEFSGNIIPIYDLNNKNNINNDTQNDVYIKDNLVILK
jgi:hypothetical protein